jgi:hypothetical protein
MSMSRTTPINPISQAIKTPWQDPILLELHATREKLASEYDNDIKSICDAARIGLLGNKNALLSVLKKV